MLRKLTAVVLVFAMIFQMTLSMVYGSVNDISTSFTDIEGASDVAKSAINKWVKSGVVSGVGKGKYAPLENVPRYQFAVILDRIMGYKYESENTFMDLENHPYKSAVLRSVYAGVFDKALLFKPNEYVSRYEAAEIMARALDVEYSNNDVDLSLFADFHEIPISARGMVKAITDNGIMGGELVGEELMFKPHELITRQDMAIMLSNAIDILINEAESKAASNQEYKNSVVINKPGTELSNTYISGDLIIAEGVGEGEIFLDNVTVMGRLVVKAGGENSINISNSFINTTTVDKKNSDKVSIKISKDTTFDALRVSAGNVLVAGYMQDNPTVNLVALDEGATVSIEEGVSVKTVNMTQSAGNTSLDIKGEVGSLNVMGDSGNISIDGTVGSLNVTGIDNVIVINGDVDEVVVTEPNARLIINGTVKNIVFKENAAGASVSVSNTGTVENIDASSQVEVINEGIINSLTSASNEVSLSGSGTIKAVEGDVSLAAGTKVGSETETDAKPSPLPRPVSSPSPTTSPQSNSQGNSQDNAQDNSTSTPSYSPPPTAVPEPTPTPKPNDLNITDLKVTWLNSISFSIPNNVFENVKESFHEKIKVSYKDDSTKQLTLMKDPTLTVEVYPNVITEGYVIFAAPDYENADRTLVQVYFNEEFEKDKVYTFHFTAPKYATYQVDFKLPDYYSAEPVFGNATVSDDGTTVSAVWENYNVFKEYNPYLSIRVPINDSLTYGCSYTLSENDKGECVITLYLYWDMEEGKDYTAYASVSGFSEGTITWQGKAKPLPELTPSNVWVLAEDRITFRLPYTQYASTLNPETGYWITTMPVVTVSGPGYEQTATAQYNNYYNGVYEPGYSNYEVFFDESFDENTRYDVTISLDGYQPYETTAQWSSLGTVDVTGVAVKGSRWIDYKLPPGQLTAMPRVVVESSNGEIILGSNYSSDAANGKYIYRLNTDMTAGNEYAIRFYMDGYNTYSQKITYNPSDFPVLQISNPRVIDYESISDESSDYTFTRNQLSVTFDNLNKNLSWNYYNIYVLGEDDRLLSTSYVSGIAYEPIIMFPDSFSAPIGTPNTIQSIMPNKPYPITFNVYGYQPYTAEITWAQPTLPALSNPKVEFFGDRWIKLTIDKTQIVNASSYYDWVELRMSGNVSKLEYAQNIAEGYVIFDLYETVTAGDYPVEIKWQGYEPYRTVLTYDPALFNTLDVTSIRVLDERWIEYESPNFVDLTYSYNPSHSIISQTNISLYGQIPTVNRTTGHTSIYISTAEVFKANIPYSIAISLPGFKTFKTELTWDGTAGALNITNLKAVDNTHITFNYADGLLDSINTSSVIIRLKHPWNSQTLSGNISLNKERGIGIISVYTALAANETYTFYMDIAGYGRFEGFVMYNPDETPDLPITDLKFDSSTQLSFKIPKAAVMDTVFTSPPQTTLYLLLSLLGEGFSNEMSYSARLTEDSSDSTMMNAIANVSFVNAGVTANTDYTVKMNVLGYNPFSGVARWEPDALPELSAVSVEISSPIDFFVNLSKSDGDAILLGTGLAYVEARAKTSSPLGASSWFNINFAPQDTKYMAICSSAIFEEDIDYTFTVEIPGYKPTETTARYTSTKGQVYPVNPRISDETTIKFDAVNIGSPSGAVEASTYFSVRIGEQGNINTIGSISLHPSGSGIPDMLTVTYFKPFQPGVNYDLYICGAGYSLYHTVLSWDGVTELIGSFAVEGEQLTEAEDTAEQDTAENETPEGDNAEEADDGDSDIPVPSGTTSDSSLSEPESEVPENTDDSIEDEEIDSTDDSADVEENDATDGSADVEENDATDSSADIEENSEPDVSNEVEMSKQAPAVKPKEIKSLLACWCYEPLIYAIEVTISEEFMIIKCPM